MLCPKAYHKHECLQSCACEATKIYLYMLCIRWLLVAYI